MKERLLTHHYSAYGLRKILPLFVLVFFSVLAYTYTSSAFASNATNPNGTNTSSSGSTSAPSGGSTTTTPSDNTTNNPPSPEQVSTANTGIAESFSFPPLLMPLGVGLTPVCYTQANTQSSINFGLGAMLTQYVVAPIKDQMTKVTFTLFNSMANNPVFKKAISSLLILYVVITAILYTLGLTQFTQQELAVRIAKFAVVGVFISPVIGDQTPWAFFNKYFFNMFTGGSAYLTNLMISLYDPAVQLNFTPQTIGQVTVDFSFFDTTIAIIFSKITWIKLASLVFTGVMGIFLAALIIWAFIIFVVGTMKAVMLYVFSIIGLSLLIILGPIFIAFIIFKQTNSLFETWVKQMVNYMLQPVLMFSVLVLFNYWVFAVVSNLLNFDMCKKCVISMGTPALTLISSLGLTIPSFSFCLLQFYQPWGYEGSFNLSNLIATGMSNLGLPDLLCATLMLLILVFSMDEFLSFASGLASALTGMQGGGLKEASDKAYGGRNPETGKTYGSVGRVTEWGKSAGKSAVGRATSPITSKVMNYMGRGTPKPEPDSQKKTSKGDSGVKQDEKIGRVKLK